MIILYEKSTCTKCRETKKILDESGVEYKEVFYYETPISKEKLSQLLQKLGIKASDLIRKKEAIYKELALGEERVSENTLIEAMIANPDLIERPIIEKGDRAVLGRPPESVEELL